MTIVQGIARISIMIYFCFEGTGWTQYIPLGIEPGILHQIKAVHSSKQSR